METIWTKIRADVSYSCSSSSSIDVSALTGTPTTKTKTMWQYKAKVKGYFPTLIGAGIWIRLARCRRYFTAGGRKFRFLWHRVVLTIDWIRLLGLRSNEMMIIQIGLVAWLMIWKSIILGERDRTGWNIWGIIPAGSICEIERRNL